MKVQCLNCRKEKEHSNEYEKGALHKNDNGSVQKL